MGFHGTPGHVELFGNFRIVTALEQQLGDLLFPRAQLDKLFRHIHSPGDEIITHAVKGSFAQIPCWKRPSPPNPEKNGIRYGLGIQKFIAFALPRRADFLR
jgi:hypothetical protein